MTVRRLAAALAFMFAVAGCDYPFRTQPPELPAPEIAVETPTRNPRPAWSWSVPEGADRFRWWLEGDPSVRHEGGIDTVGWIPPSDLPPGEHVLRLQVRSILGTWSRPHASQAVVTVLQPFGYRDPRIAYYGRYHDNGEYIYSGFREGWIRFRVTGTRRLRIVARAHLLGCLPEVNAFVDDIPSETGFGGPIPERPGDAQDREIVVETDTLTPGEHRIELRLAANSPDHSAPLRGTDRLGLVRLELDTGGALLPWIQEGRWRLAVFSDSWGKHFPHAFDPDDFQVHNMSHGGFSSQDGARWYPWLLGEIRHRDPRWDAVLIHYGVNDFYRGFSAATFRENILRMVEAVSADHPQARIFLGQAPRNAAGGRDFDKYGSVLAELAGRFERVDYIPTGAVWDSLQWAPDQSHLDIASLRRFGALLGREMRSRMP